jgi:hypothetical protein
MVGGRRWSLIPDAMTSRSPDRLDQTKTNEGSVLRNRVVPICLLPS